MEPLARHECIQIRRTYDCDGARIEESPLEMILYQDEIRIGDERVSLQDVFDISYYPKNKQAGQIGFLYLHTSRGVRTYHVREHPAPFVRLFKSWMNERPPQ